MRTALVTGGAGFIGSHVVDSLVAKGYAVRVLDNLSSGRRAFLDHHLRGGGPVELVVGDCRDESVVAHAMREADLVLHAAANPEVRSGATDPRAHLEQNVLATWSVLEAARRLRPRLLLFTSTSTVYGEATRIPTPDDYGPLEPISVYGAAKLASEAFLSAACHTFGLEAVTYRFANVVGPRATHGVIVDFIRKLKADPVRLEILGDGTQTKSYIHVDDCVAGILAPLEHARRRRPYDAYNIGTRDALPVTRIADIVCDVLGLSGVRYMFTGGVQGGRGWVGDVKRMQLDGARLERLGWKPARSSEDAVRDTAVWLRDNWAKTAL